MSEDDKETSGSEQSQVSVFVADRRSAEALGLEIRRLAKSLGLHIEQIKVELADDTTSRTEQGEEAG